MMLDENKREYRYTDESNQKQIGVHYYPSIGAEWVAGNDLTRVNIRGEWMKGSLFVKGKYLQPAFELTLSNSDV